MTAGYWWAASAALAALTVWLLLRQPSHKLRHARAHEKPYAAQHRTGWPAQDLIAYIRRADWLAEQAERTVPLGLMWRDLL